MLVFENSTSVAFLNSKIRGRGTRRREKQLRSTRALAPHLPRAFSAIRKRVRSLNIRTRLQLNVFTIFGKEIKTEEHKEYGYTMYTR